MEASAMPAFPKMPIPAHVPPDLVRRDFPFIFGTITEKDPFTDLADAVHEGPEVIYAPHAYPGGTPAWIFRRTEDLRKIFYDTGNFSPRDFSPFAKLVGESWINSPVELDPPHHGPFRSMVNPVFTPKAMTLLEGRIRSYACEYIDRFAAKGACEFMGDFAFEFPICVFMELMGLPHDRTAEFLDWEMNLLHNHDLSKVAAATRNVVDFLREEIEDRKRNPGTDLFSYAVQAEVEGRPLTDDELVGFTFNLFIGGLDTVSTNMGLHFWHLATHPEDQATLRAQPEKIPNAIEELMRAYGAVTTFRTCVNETVIRGVTIKPGDKIAMSTTLAGRDENEFPDPSEVRLDRRPRHVGFGYGPHICVGIHLARREMRIAMEEFLSRIPEFKLAPGQKVRCHLGMIQPVELPLVWSVAR
jgi:cytochrome P450